MKIDVQDRVRAAQEYFLEGRSCTQSVVLAFQDILGGDKELLERLSIGLGAGVGRMRQVCGTVSAMAMIAGTLACAKVGCTSETLSSGKTDARESAGTGAESMGNATDTDSSDMVRFHQRQKSETYAIVQKLAGTFREENGSIVCAELLRLRAEARKSHVPEERTAEYYKSRPCLALVGCSARIIAEYIANYC